MIQLEVEMNLLTCQVATRQLVMMMTDRTDRQQVQLAEKANIMLAENASVQAHVSDVSSPIFRKSKKCIVWLQIRQICGFVCSSEFP